MSAFLQNNQTVKCECTITNVGYTIFESTMSPKYIEYYNIHEWKTKSIFQLTEVYKSPQFISLMIHHGLATFLHRLYDINPPIIYKNYRSWFMAFEHLIVYLIIFIGK